MISYDHSGTPYLFLYIDCFSHTQKFYMRKVYCFYTMTMQRDPFETDIVMAIGQGKHIQIDITKHSEANHNFLYLSLKLRLIQINQSNTHAKIGSFGLMACKPLMVI